MLPLPPLRLLLRLPKKTPGYHPQLLLQNRRLHPHRLDSR
jgi:hypothetical protein